MASPIDWSVFNAGPTWDGDLIDAVIEPNAVPADTVEFVLETTPATRWWKALTVPDGLGSSWEIWAQDEKHSDRVSLWADQVRNGQSLEFKKAKSLGIHTGMYLLGGLDRLTGGSRVTFRWVQDEFPDYNGGLDGLEVGLEFIPGVGFWAQPGQSFNVVVHGANFSNEIFTSDARYKIGSWPQDNLIWGRSRVELPESIGQEVIDFAVPFTVTAPSEPGEYPFGWKMLQELVRWFGGAVRPRPSGSITVASVRPSPPPPPPPPVTVAVPAVVGLLASQARDAIKAARLQVGVVGNPTGESRFEYLRVIAQAPTAGQMVPPGSQVNFGVELAQPIPAQGVSLVRVYNANGESHTVELWAWDFTSQRWRDIGSIAMNSFIDFTPADQHAYQLVATDAAWCGANDPTNNACVRWYTIVPITGDLHGSAISMNIL